MINKITRRKLLKGTGGLVAIAMLNSIRKFIPKAIADEPHLYDVLRNKEPKGFLFSEYKGDKNKFWNETGKVFWRTLEDEEGAKKMVELIKKEDNVEVSYKPIKDFLRYVSVQSHTNEKELLASLYESIEKRGVLRTVARGSQLEDIMEEKQLEMAGMTTGEQEYFLLQKANYSIDVYSKNQKLIVELKDNETGGLRTGTIELPAYLSDADRDILTSGPASNEAKERLNKLLKVHGHGKVNELESVMDKFALTIANTIYDIK